MVPKYPRHVKCVVKIADIKNIEKLPDEFITMIEKGETKQRAVCDFIAGMSDRYAINIYKEIMIPKSWSVKSIENR